jgi:hypothetical protein
MVTLAEALLRAEGALDLMIATDIARLRRQLAQHGADEEQAAGVVADRLAQLVEWKSERLAELRVEATDFAITANAAPQAPSATVH